MSETDIPAPSWAEIEARPGFEGMQRLALEVIEPRLRALPLGQTQVKNELQTPFGLFMFGAFALFVLWSMSAPLGAVAGMLSFLLFPLFFAGAGFAFLYLYRDKIGALLLSGQANFLARTEALTAVGERLGLTYVGAPGGAPGALKALAKLSFMPPALKEAADTLDSHGGLDMAVAAVYEAGLMGGNVVVLGTEEQKAKYHRQAAENTGMEDGFAGKWAGAAFEAFEWRENQEDAPTIHHLCLVMACPRRLHGVTQLRSRGTPWPANHEGRKFDTVSLGVAAFEERFRLRSTDQVEARLIFNPAVIERAIQFAHGAELRASAMGDRLVFAFAGQDRFKLVDLLTGDWSDETVRRTLGQIGEMLDLVEQTAHAFGLARRA